LRPESLRLRRHQVFKAASALVFAGRPIETVTALADLVDINAFKTILKHLRERQGGAPSSALHGLSLCLLSIAKHQVRVDAATLQRMRRICANYKVGQEERTSRNHTRLKKPAAQYPGDHDRWRDPVGHSFRSARDEEPRHPGL
jgi:hypothetical protein